LLDSPPQGAILLVDDDEALADLGHARLTRLGYDVVVATSSVAALARFRATQQHFALLITDYLLPDLTGLELAVACQQLWPELPVILCTGSSATLEDLPAPTPARIDAFLQKPFGAEALAHAVMQVLPPGSCGRPRTLTNGLDSDL
jgi:CheY-like chemotaxis protein